VTSASQFQLTPLLRRSSAPRSSAGPVVCRRTLIRLHRPNLSRCRSRLRRRCLVQRRYAQQQVQRRGRDVGPARSIRDILCLFRNIISLFSCYLLCTSSKGVRIRPAVSRRSIKACCSPPIAMAQKRRTAPSQAALQRDRSSNFKPSCAPAFLLPDELWTLVWSSLQMHQKVAITRVCRSWRALAHSNSSLWSQIELRASCNLDTSPRDTYHVTSPPITAIQAILERGKETSLSLFSAEDLCGDVWCTNMAGARLDTLLDILMPHWQRVRRIRVWIPRAGMVWFFVGRLMKYSRLVDLQVDAQLAWDEVRAPVVLFAEAYDADGMLRSPVEPLPQLRRLKFTSNLVRFVDPFRPSPRSPQLQLSNLAYIAVGIQYAADFVFMLQSCPQLEEARLDLYNFSNEHLQPSSPTAWESLGKNLHYLRLDAVSDEFEDYVRSLERCIFVRPTLRNFQINYAGGTAHMRVGLSVLQEISSPLHLTVSYVRQRVNITVRQTTVASEGTTSKSRVLSCPFEDAPSVLGGALWEYLTPSIIVELEIVDIEDGQAVSVFTGPRFSSVKLLKLVVTDGPAEKFMATVSAVDWFRSIPDEAEVTLEYGGTIQAFANLRDFVAFISEFYPRGGVLYSGGR